MKKRFYPIGILLMLAAVVGYLLSAVTGAVDQPEVGLREMGVGLLICLYTYGAGVFLYARRERLFAGSFTLPQRVGFPSGLTRFSSDHATTNSGPSTSTEPAVN